MKFLTRVIEAKYGEDLPLRRPQKELHNVIRTVNFNVEWHRPEQNHAWTNMNMIQRRRFIKKHNLEPEPLVRIIRNRSNLVTTKKQSRTEKTRDFNEVTRRTLPAMAVRRLCEVPTQLCIEKRCPKCSHNAMSAALYPESAHAGQPHAGKKPELIRKGLTGLEFDANEWRGRDQLQLIVDIFEDLGLMEAFNIGEASLRTFVAQVRGAHNRNDCHNWTHAMRVAHSIYWLMTTGAPTPEPQSTRALTLT